MHFRVKTTIKQHFFFFSALNIIAAVLAIAIISNSMFEKAMTGKAEIFQKREVSLVCNHIDLLVNSINDYILTLSVDSTVQNIMRNYDDVPLGQEERYNIQLQLMRAVYAKTSLNSYIDSVAVISKNGTFFDMGAYSEADLNQIIKENQIDLETMENQPVWYGPMEMESELVGKEDVFVITKPVVDLWSPTTLGYLFTIVKESTISGFYNNLLDKNAKMYVTDENFEIISASDKEMLYKNMEEIGLDGDKEEYVETVGEIPQNNWKVIDFVPKAYLISEMDKINFSMLNIGFAAILIAFLCSYLIASQVTKPLNKLAKAMKSYDFVGGGSHVAEDGFYKEVNFLTIRFNQLVDRVEELMNQIQRENKQKRDYEFRLIQEQIKPHFLYNSLETIISLIGISMNQKAMQYAKSLGSFYRISLSGGSDMITLGEEIKLIKNYLSMQAIRYVDKLEYQIEENKELQDVKIPKLTLQPIVENAIYHGLKPKKEKSKISIKCFGDGEDVLISIFDTGIGMSEEKAKQILSVKDTQEKGGFGLKSIDHRLKLVFGKRYGLEIESKMNVYTEVVVKIPVKFEEDRYVKDFDRG